MGYIFLKMKSIALFCEPRIYALYIRLARINPGLRSRFNKFIVFDDYSAEELLLILQSMCKKANLRLSSQAEDSAYSFFQKQCALDTFANARDVRNFFEKALVNQANRLAQMEDLSDEMLFAIEYEDIEDSVC